MSGKRLRAKTSKSDQKKAIEILRLAVVCPAKARVLAGKNSVVLLSREPDLSGAPSVHEWGCYAAAAGQDLLTLLKTLVRKEIGRGFTVLYRENVKIHCNFDGQFQLVKKSRT